MQKKSHANNFGYWINRNLLFCLAAVLFLSLQACTGMDAGNASDVVSGTGVKRTGSTPNSGVGPANVNDGNSTPTPTPTPSPTPTPTPNPTPTPTPNPTPSPTPTPTPPTGLQGAITTSGETSKFVPYTQLVDGWSASSTDGIHPIVKWAWNFGGPSSDPEPQTTTGEIVAHTYATPGTYTISLTVTDSSGATSTTSVNVNISGFSGPTYYISASGSDANSGLDTSHPWQTIQQFINVVGSGTQGNPARALLKSGDTFNVSNWQFLPRPSILSSYGSGAHPKIVAQSLNNSGIYVDAKDAWGYAVTIDGIDVQYKDTNRVNGAMVYLQAEGSVFRNGTITGGGLVTGAGSTIEHATVTRSAGVGLYCAGYYVTARNDIFSDSGTNTIDRDHQVYCGGRKEGALRNVFLFQDTVFDGGTSNGYAGIRMVNSDYTVFRRVEAKRNWLGLNCGQQAPYPNSDHFIVEDSIVHDQGKVSDPGLGSLDHGAFGLSVDGVYNLTVRNSLFYNNNNSPSGAGALIEDTSDVGYNTQTAKFYNNIFYNERMDRGVIFVDSNPADQNQKFIFRNNIFWLASNTPSNTAMYFLLNDTSNINNVDSDYNVIYWEGKNPSTDNYFAFGGNGAPNATITQWQAYDGSGHAKDTHSLFVDPLFINPGALDFHLQSNSLAIDKGQVLLEIWNDIEGTLRPQGAGWDIGAYEFH